MAGGYLLMEKNGSGVTQAVYTSPATPFGGHVSQRRGSTSSFYHPDHLGSIWNLTNTSGTVTDTYAFDAWGNQLSSSGSTVNPHRYVGALGYQTEPSIDLDYVRARWLRPGTASWLSVDPVETEERYGYVSGAPAAGCDPSGRIGALGLYVRIQDASERAEATRAAELAARERVLERVRERSAQALGRLYPWLPLAAQGGVDLLAEALDPALREARGALRDQLLSSEQPETTLDGLLRMIGEDPELGSLIGQVTYRETALEAARIYLATSIIEDRDSVGGGSMEWLNWSQRANDPGWPTSGLSPFSILWIIQPFRSAGIPQGRLEDPQGRPWCSMFAWTMYRIAGLFGAGEADGYAYSGTWVGRAWGDDDPETTAVRSSTGYVPVPGDLFVQKPGDEYTHVGMVEYVTAVGGQTRLVTIEGNADQRVVRWNKRTPSSVTYFVHVAKALSMEDLVEVVSRMRELVRLAQPYAPGLTARDVAVGLLASSAARPVDAAGSGSVR